MIVHGFMTHAGDAWILEYHLECWSRFVDAICIDLSDWPEGESIVRRWPKVVSVTHWRNDPLRPTWNANGLTGDDGIRRQRVWDACAGVDPDWILLGDTDEVPTPDVIDWIPRMDPAIDVYYVHWVNLWKDVRHALGGANAKWSFQNPRTNKKGFACRRRPGVCYRYDLRMEQHARMEPNPLSPGRTVCDSTHVLAESPKLVHYKYANWDRWQRHPLSQAGGQYSHMADDATIVEVPAEWLWDLPIAELNHACTSAVSGAVAGLSEIA